MDEDGASPPAAARICLTVIDLFEAQVAQTPEAIAVVFATRELTYRELDGRADGIARALQASGVGRDIVVAVALERSIELLVAVLAVLKAGGAYLVLDPAYPQERLTYMLADAQPKVLVTNSSLMTLFPEYHGLARSIDEIDGGFAAEPGKLAGLSRVATRESDTALAYVVYTSGSTGTPKGVAMEHRPLFNMVKWQTRASQVGAGERTLQFISPAFDASVEEIFATWCSGGTLVLAPEAARRDPEALYDLITNAAIARAFLPYPALQGLATATMARKAAPQCLKEIVVGGEALRISDQIASLFARLPGCVLVNQYGPSEAHVFVTAFELRGDPQNWPALPPIGKPIADVRIHILDESRQPVRDGVPGEIFIGGPALARGYLHDPGSTAERFVADPFAEGERLYRTGDLGRRLPDGNIAYLGRLDRQVKLRGFRVEPGEIEVVLARHPQVSQALVELREFAPGDKRLVAYVVPDAGSSPAVPDLVRFAKANLPDYMVPSLVVLIDAVPLTPSGKIDRDRLAAPSAYLRPVAADVIAPRSETECRLATIWAKALAVRTVGVTDNFFEIGGDSVLALHLMTEIERGFARTLPFGVIFSAPTIEQLAAVLDTAGPPAAGFSLVPLHTAGTGPPIFFTHWVHRDLVRCLIGDRPIYSLSYGLAALTPGQRPVVPERLEDIAAQYIEEVRQVQPHGPYSLIGYSAGGWFAFEMAQQLLAQGETIGFLGLIDTPAPGAYFDDEVARFPLHRQIINFLRLTPSEIIEIAAHHYDLHRKRLRDKIQPNDYRSLMKLENFLVEVRLAAKFVRSYTPREYPGKLTYFKAVGMMALKYRVTPLEQAWTQLSAGRLELHEVPGRHRSMTAAPFARALAAKLRACLDGDTEGSKTSAGVRSERRWSRWLSHP